MLLDRNPGMVPRQSLTNQMVLAPDIPVGLPSHALQRRPDVLGAEQSLVAANADIGACAADFFPRIGLTTFFGQASLELSAVTAGSPVRK
jgi:multidrug efflux system outer membrane protein